MFIRRCRYRRLRTRRRSEERGRINPAAGTRRQHHGQGYEQTSRVFANRRVAQGHGP